MNVLGYYPVINDQISDDAICADCQRFVVQHTGQPTPPEWEPIFYNMEADTPTHCVGCRALIPHELTSEGYAYVWSALQEGTGDREVLDAWKDLYGPPPEADADEVLDAYLECAIWSSVDDAGEPLDKTYDVFDLAPEVTDHARADIESFLENQAIDLYGIDPRQIGHDFWLTRNGHGTGFWDRGLGERGDRLTEAAEVGEVNLWVGDDGRIYD